MNKERLREINARLAEIKEKLQARASLVNSDIDALSEETNKLIEEKASIFAEEKRSILDAVERGEKMTQEEQTRKLNAGMKLTKRQAINLLIAKQARGTNLSDVEKRAVDTSLTTTATVYVAASSGADGVNNGGVSINPKLITDFLFETYPVSPIFRDVAFTAIKGLTKFMFRESRTNAYNKAEGKKVNDGQMKWASVEGTKGYLETIMNVTDELQILSDIDFGAYLVDQMFEDMQEDWTNDLIYGTGLSDEVKGITEFATEQTYTAGGEVAALEAAVNALPANRAAGAKIYVSRSIYNTLLFAKDDNGAYLYPPFNNGGIKTFGAYQIEIDDHLNDGDILVGNVSKWFRVNMLSELRIEKDRDVKAKVDSYVASVYSATAGLSGAFVYAKVQGE